MSEQNDATGTVPAEAHVLLENGEPVSAIVSLPENDTEEAGEETHIETEATRIAEIHGETTVAVAAIEADVEQARIEADAERNRNWEAERETLQASIAELTNQIAELETRLSPAPAALLIPTPLAEEILEAELEAEAETVVEQNLTPQSIVENEPPVENGPSEEEESAEEITVPARKRRRLI